MRAVKLYSTGDIRTVDVDVPSPAKNEILIKVAAAGIAMGVFEAEARVADEVLVRTALHRRESAGTQHTAASARTRAGNAPAAARLAACLQGAPPYCCAG